jgi:outer membrane immunogenic protein
MRNTAAAIAGIMALMATTGARAASDHGWSGFYVGAIGMITTGEADYSGIAVDLDEIDVDLTGAAFGFQAGYDMENVVPDLAPGMVAGVVADISRTDIDARVGRAFSSQATGGSDAEVDVTWLGTLTARAGVEVGSSLVYGLGGMAYGSLDRKGGPSPFDGFDLSKDRVGYVAGGGIEVPVANGLSVQTEYRYIDLGADKSGDAKEGFAFHSVKAGLNYRF